MIIQSFINPSSCYVVGKKSRQFSSHNICNQFYHQKFDPDALGDFQEITCTKLTIETLEQGMK